MVRIRYFLDDRRQMGQAGMAYSYRTVSFVIGCSRSTVARCARALSDPLPVTVAPRVGITQDDIALTETVTLANRRVKAIHIFPLLKDAGLVISLSTLWRIVKKLDLQRYVAVPNPLLTSEHAIYALNMLKSTLQTIPMPGGGPSSAMRQYCEQMVL